MQKLKRYLTRPVCLSLALVILAASMTVAALNGSPYDTLKDTAFNMLSVKNATISYDASISVNGVEHESAYGVTAFSENASSTYGGNADSPIDSASQANYQSKKYSLYPASTRDGVATQYRLYYNNEDMNVSDDFSLFSGLSEYSRSDMYVRLGELALDLVVGDLKNNIAVSGYDDVKTMSMALTAQQIPELYNALLTVILAENSSYSGNRNEYNESAMEMTETRYDTKAMTKTVTVYPYAIQYYEPETGEELDANDSRANQAYSWSRVDWEHPITAKSKTTPLTAADFAGTDAIDQPFKDGVIDYAGFTVRVDKNDVLVDGRADIRVNLTTLFGETVVIEMTMNMACENVGTTDPQPPVAGIEEIFTQEFVDAFRAELPENEKAYYGSTSFLFSLNDDGTIDQSSIMFEGGGHYMMLDGNGRVVSTVNPFTMYEKDIEVATSSIGIIGGADGPETILID